MTMCYTISSQQLPLPLPLCSDAGEASMWLLDLLETTAMFPSNHILIITFTKKKIQETLNDVLLDTL